MSANSLNRCHTCDGSGFLLVLDTAELISCAECGRDWLDAHEFYELCQQYRHSVEPDVVKAFEALKAYIRDQVDTQMRDCCDSARDHYERGG
jgi:hypothetical protein